MVLLYLKNAWRCSALVFGMSDLPTADFRTFAPTFHPECVGVDTDSMALYIQGGRKEPYLD